MTYKHYLSVAAGLLSAISLSVSGIWASWGLSGSEKITSLLGLAIAVISVFLGSNTIVNGGAATTSTNGTQQSVSDTSNVQAISATGNLMNEVATEIQSLSGSPAVHKAIVTTKELLNVK